ncbi:hypothetical protein N0B31_13040 [Salinirubellus salinus]|uniref:Uncharacterized protein n=1 Tax=Salinirubellus salinus TaxID=1364945 RepID=A0A9E7U9A6_9EURY|nr:hypothetical protein [Salinirubellus salinus]UWM53073.1 hypothetical protein N0B31_13040 [Salinirubellus salinus]
MEGDTGGLTVTVTANGQEETLTLPPADAPAPEVPGLPGLGR